MKQNIQILLNRPFAHRGLHSNNDIVPENSIIAFQKAISLNFAIELDVHLLSDNKVAVFHDDNVERLCGINIGIEELDSIELSKLKLLNSENKIPLLNEVLHLVNGKVPLLIELKINSKVGKLERAVFHELDSYNGEFAIQSFNPSSLNWFLKNAPHILRGQLSSDFKNEKMNPFSKFLRKNLFLNFISKPQFLAYDSSAMPNRKIARLRKRGLPVLCWTIKSKEEYERIKSFCDNIIFENFIPK